LSRIVQKRKINITSVTEIRLKDQFVVREGFIETRAAVIRAISADLSHAGIWAASRNPERAEARRREWKDLRIDGAKGGLAPQGFTRQILS
jgi:hypothetical protein